jgi:opacity protein-like surface antigen
VRRAAVVGLAVFALIALPNSARSDTAKTIAEAAVAGAVMGIVCTSVALTAEDEVDEDDFARRGWMVGVAGSSAIELFEEELQADFRRQVDPIGGGFGSTASVASLPVDNSLGFNGRVGYRCHPRFSAEVEVEWLHGFDADLEQPGVVQLARVEVDPLVVTANAKGYLLTGRYQPFLLVGAGAMSGDLKVRDPVGLSFTGIDSQSENVFAMRFGGGIDLYATKNIVVSLEADYVLPFGKLEDLNYVTLSWGFQYRF